MDIKIGKTNRLRLDSNDVQILKINSTLKKTFFLTDDFFFTVEISLCPERLNSELQRLNEKLFLLLTVQDFQQLESDQNKKCGLKLDHFQIQIDLWSAEKRSSAEK